MRNFKTLKKLFFQELNEDTKILKEDFSRVKTHLNVAAKLELQTQEKMYESRLYHLENVLEEMRQREGHFMRLAEETAVLKDQVGLRLHFWLFKLGRRMAIDWPF